jgi:hypothetical protein
MYARSSTLGLLSAVALSLPSDSVTRQREGHAVGLARAVSVSLLVRLGEPSDSAVGGVDPVLVHVHVAILPTATVSIAGFLVPLPPSSRIPAGWFSASG